MKKTVVLSLIGLAAVGAAQAQEVGRVLSSTPMIQQVAVPRQVCSSQPVAVQEPNSGAGGVMGAIAGGAVGSQIGGGSGRGVATVLGVLGGAVLGNRIEGSGTSVQNYQSCTTQTYYENRATGYNVVYEYAGKQYTVHLPYDPGPTIRLQVSPVTTAPPLEQPAAAPGTPMPAPMVSVPPPVITSSTVVVPAAPVYYAPYYYRPAYYPPVSLSIGYVHHHGGGRHWR
ncbi:MAG TPA: glycine zipper 2TM domain-containing protein [Ramlibacter sp.]|jgi:uncharacterized protein YcfJ|uniref:glycine zipper 2TM domain-containing protein n=1 Tax=Ramlibacter sp. TaxID=1917967 RepID=UPI002D4BCBC1|nr:glycine zipper 2TM domain-containing protein [Ramlibacter sp.]HZY19096.1 glycine zipper 2TM domain-containing protein [Ramlibacter sp.]